MYKLNNVLLYLYFSLAFRICSSKTRRVAGNPRGGLSKTITAKHVQEGLFPACGRQKILHTQVDTFHIFTDIFL